ncbi:MAG TPA: large conductance mechanosensitive channel protein MscL [Actinopolymorphaceae bacterium]
MLAGFKAFLMRGNVVDLAVAVVVGAAFTKIVDNLVQGLVTPLIAALFGETSVAGVGKFTVNNAEFSVGLVLDAALQFVLVAAAIYFLIVYPLNLLAERRKRGEEPGPIEENTALLREIRDLLAARARENADVRRPKPEQTTPAP